MDVSGTRKGGRSGYGGVGVGGEPVIPSSPTRDRRDGRKSTIPVANDLFYHGGRGSVPPATPPRWCGRWDSAPTASRDLPTSGGTLRSVTFGPLTTRANGLFGSSGDACSGPVVRPGSSWRRPEGMLLRLFRIVPEPRDVPQSCLHHVFGGFLQSCLVGRGESHHYCRRVLPTKVTGRPHLGRPVSVLSPGG